MIIGKKAVCPNPDCDSKQFYATAHVTEEWVVDEDGYFTELAKSYDQDVLHSPDEHDLWVCVKCGTEAKFVDADSLTST